MMVFNGATSFIITLLAFGLLLTDCRQGRKPERAAPHSDSLLLQGRLEFFKYPVPVLDNGPQGSYDEGYIGEPCVQINDGLYEMWYEAMEYPPYFGGNQGVGNQWAIGYASSADGIQWTRDPRKVFDVNPKYAWSSEHVLEPWCFKDNGLYRLYFTADMSLTQIGYAESDDAIHWTNFELILEESQLAGKKIDGQQIIGGSEPSVVRRDEGDYIMYFQGETEGGKWDHIAYALSDDGVHFTIPADDAGNHTPAWNARDAWHDVRGLAGPCVVQHQGRYYLFGNTHTEPFDIGYAVSWDGVHFTPASENPLVTSTSFTWDDGMCYEPGVQILPSGRVQMWWNGVRQRWDLRTPLT